MKPKTPKEKICECGRAEGYHENMRICGRGCSEFKEAKTPTTKCPICEQDVDENRIVAHITGDADPKCKTPQKYWICEVSGGVLFKDRETNKFWLGGQPNRVIVPVFRDKKEAQKFARNAKHTRPDLINWTRVSEVMII